MMDLGVRVMKGDEWVMGRSNGESTECTSAVEKQQQV